MENNYIDMQNKLLLILNYYTIQFLFSFLKKEI